MKLSEQIQDQQIRLNIAQDCVKLMEAQVEAKTGVTGILFKTLYKGIKSISPNYAQKAIFGLIPSISQALNPLWDEGIEKGNPVTYLQSNPTLTANTILSVTDERIKKTANKIIKVSYEKIRNSLQDEIEQVVPQLAEILGKYAKKEK